MFRVRVKNQTQAQIMVPLSSLVPQAEQVKEVADPGEEASCVFRHPVTSEIVQNAILLWAVDMDIIIAFELADTISA